MSGPIGSTCNPVTHPICKLFPPQNWRDFALKCARFLLKCRRILAQVPKISCSSAQDFAGDMLTILFDALKLTNIARIRNQDAFDVEDIMVNERRYDACCELAIAFHENQPPLVPPSGEKKRGRPKRRIGHNLALLQRLISAVLLFLHDLDVPFSNNEAERELRMTKVRQKILRMLPNRTGCHGFLYPANRCLNSMRTGLGYSRDLENTI